jgi:hypothetical protein
MNTAQAQVLAQMTALIAAKVSNPLVKAELEAVPDIVDAIKPAVLSILHSTNNEPWWQSQVTWGQIITGAGLALTAAGVTVNAPYVELLSSLAVPVAGIAVTLYGRWKAKKPLFTS